MRGGLALLGLAAVVVGCAAGNAGSPTGAAGGAGTSSPTGAAGTGGGAAGTTACTAPPVVKMAWTLGNSASGPEITCDQAGASTVQLFMNSMRNEFPCSAKSGTSGGITPGTSTPRVLLAGSQGTVLSQGNLAAVTIPSCGVVDLGRLRFVVTPTGAAGTSGAAGTGGSGGAGGSAGSGGAGGSTGAAGTGGGTGPCNAMPIFATHSCAAAMACHDASGSAANFDMQTAGWEKTLVGRTSKAGGAPGLGSVCMSSGMPYLVAGSSPARGLFLDKLSSTKPACGAQMPLIPPNLSAQELDCVQRWANGLTK